MNKPDPKHVTSSESAMEISAHAENVEALRLPERAGPVPFRPTVVAGSMVQYDGGTPPRAKRVHDKMARRIIRRNYKKTLREAAKQFVARIRGPR